jgi:hypothetical protein
MKKRKVILGVGTLAFVALAVLYYAAVAPAVVGTERVAAAFRASLREGPGLEARHGKATFRLLPRPAVALADVVIVNGVGKELLRADEATLGLSYFGFLALKPSLAAVEFRRPRLDLAPGDLSFGEAGKGTPFRGTVGVREGFVRYAAERRTILLDGVSGNVRCRVSWGEELDLRGKLQAEKLNLGAGTEEAVGGMALAAEGKISYRREGAGGRLTFEELDFLFGKARLSVIGELQTGPGEKDIDLTLRGKKMAVSQVLPALAPRFGEAELEGEIDLALTVKGSWGEGERPEVRGELEVRKGRLKPDDGEPIKNVAATVSFQGEKYVVENFRGDTKRGSFKGYGAVRPEEGWPFTLKIEGALPLEVAAVLLGVPEPYELAGPVQLNVDVDGELSSAGRTSVDGTVELVDCQVRLKPFAVPFRNLKGTAYCDGYKVKAGKIKGKLADREFELGGSWQGFETPRLDFVVVADDLDFDAALPNEEVRRRERERGTAPRGLPGKDLTVTGKARFKKFRLLSVAGKKLEAEFQYGGGVLNLTKLDFGAYDGKVRAQMTVHPGARPRYTCSATIRDARLGVFLTENKYLEKVLTGRFSADVTFSAEGTAAEEVKRSFGGRGSLEWKGGRAAGLPLLVELKKWSRIDLYEPLQISKLWVMCDARDGTIRSADFRLENADLVVEAAGEVDLDTKLNVTVHTTFSKKAAERLAREGRALALVRDEDGRAHFNFVVTGEAAKPAFQLDAGSMLGAAGEAPGGEPAETGDLGDLF